MLQLIDVKKNYLSGADQVEALKGVSISFRKSEFVSILGPSGCGKTTLLNIIGGLDQYTSGDLVIDNRSTKGFNDRDWDTYRNHSIGFVFQSYNLIPHQSVLSNVELALTLSGVSKAERRKKAVAALEQVGLKDQLKKRPNQLSGGQMQRVAIARALVNNPEILLADEPTGALDTATSIQIMDLLKEISKDKLVIMVTHNPDLANEYSTRIIRLLDGRVTDDTNPYDGKEEIVAKPKKKEKKTSMSLFTAISLSTNNLMTKKGRTLLTSFAGSIGIIGIALILSLSHGINAYINRVQEDTLAGYPISIQAESVDMSALMVSLMGINQQNSENQHPLDAVYSSSVMGEMINSLNNAQIETNNLTLFKKFLDENEEIRQYISNIQYSYNLDMNIYTKMEDGTIVKSDIEDMMMEVFREMGFSQDMMSSAASSPLSSMGFSSIQLWQEMLPQKDGTGISDLLKQQYDMVYGAWPQNYNEVVLVVNERNELSDLVLCGLGLIGTDELVEEMKASQRGETLDTSHRSWSYEEICQKTFRIFLPYEMYQKNANGGYTLLTDAEKGLEYLYGNQNKGVNVKISGIIRKNEDAVSGMLTGALGYTSGLTDYLLSQIESSEILKEQKENAEQDIILNLPFLPKDFKDYTNDEKVTMIRAYLSALSVKEKAEIYRDVTSTPSDDYLKTAVDRILGNMTRAEMEEMAIQAFSASQPAGTDVSYIREYLAQMSDSELREAMEDACKEQISQQYKAEVLKNLAAVPEAQLAGLLDLGLAETNGYTQEEMLSLYENYMPATHSESTLEDNLELLGLVKKESPSAINIYAETFENKDNIADLIQKYNDGKDEEDKIEYTDIVAILMSSISSIINAISYVLVAFVSISLVVSSIMIGIITYISVLERTKEIGILRAIGASKKDISSVFNAESIIEGLAAGLIGIGLTLVLNVPINMVIYALTDIATLKAVLPLGGYLLILVSVFLSYIAGLIPSRFAAKKDPVEALRSE